MPVAPTPPLSGISRRVRGHDCSKGLVNRPGMESHPEVAEVDSEGGGEAAGDQFTYSTELRLRGPQWVPLSPSVRPDDLAG